jgi:hypothetical protein
MNESKCVKCGGSKNLTELYRQGNHGPYGAFIHYIPTNLFICASKNSCKKRRQENAAAYDYAATENVHFSL